MQYHAIGGIPATIETTNNGQMWIALVHRQDNSPAPGFLTFQGTTEQRAAQAAVEWLGGTLQTPADWLNADLYHGDRFTAEEQAAMQRGYTSAERRAISGQVFGGFPQAISAEHAEKLTDHLRRFTAAWR